MAIKETSHKTVIQEGATLRKAPPKVNGSRKPLSDAESRPQKKES